MAHQSLYRKYRPQTFDDVVGQEHITRTLRNAVDEGTVSHAYLFCGPRGTGKTTTARILAKALDCEKGPTSEPDDTCEACREIAEGRHPDVYELDAASRTGVDAVRDEIITKVNYAATRGGWKVYIIDEVHMLSTSAFNALLKTLEEPPAKTVFILCTTHPHKVPETIRSRCQRFDFRRIGVDDIVGRLETIAEREGITAEAGALPLIARHAAGGMRDAIGTLDQLASFTGNKISLPDVEGLLGEVDAARLAEVTGIIAARDAGGAFRFVARLVESGADVPEFVRGLTAHFRDLYVLAAGAEAEGVIEATTTEMERLKTQSGLFDIDRLSRMLDLLGELVGEMRWAPDARLSLEVALTRMARPSSDLTLESLSERIAALEAGAPAASAAASRVSAAPARKAPAEPAPASAPAGTRPGAPAPARDAAVAPAAATPAPEPTIAERPSKVSAAATAADTAGSARPAPPRSAGAIDTAAMRRAWDDVMRDMKGYRPAASKLFDETDVVVDGDTVIVEFGPNRRVPMKVAGEQETTTLLRDSIHRVTGARVAVRYQLGRGTVVRDDDLVADEGNDSWVEDAAPAPAAAGEPAGIQPAVETPGETAGSGDVERLLIEELGAEVIGEQPIE